jgi:hypothetical protein
MGTHPHRHGDDQRRYDDPKIRSWGKRVIYYGELSLALMAIAALIVFLFSLSNKAQIYAQIPDNIENIRAIDSIENVKTNLRIDSSNEKTEAFLLLIAKNQWATMNELQRNKRVDALVNDTTIPRAILMEVLK